MNCSEGVLINRVEKMNSKILGFTEWVKLELAR